MKLERIQLPAVMDIYAPEATSANRGSRVGSAKDATQEERKRGLLKRDRKQTDDGTRQDAASDESGGDTLVTSEARTLDISA